jgi:aryl-alcohol dehydrogenase-like predicted oxidoreductase
VRRRVAASSCRRGSEPKETPNEVSRFRADRWQVSEIGFGAWQIGGDWGAVDDQQSIDTLLYAYEQGVVFIDTAELYGRGHSETGIGRSLKEWRGDKVYIATKAQPIVWPSPDESNTDMRGRYPSWHLRHNVEASLKRLGVQRIDLYQLPCWLSDGLRNLDWLETLNDLRREGKIDHIGVSIRDFRPEEGVDLAQYGLVDSTSTYSSSAPPAPCFQPGRQPQPLSSLGCRSTPAH